MAAINRLREDAAVPEEAEEIPLLPSSSRDTRIFIEESKEETGALSHPAVPSEAAVGHNSAAAAPGDRDVPEDWRSRGLLATVDPADADEILRLYEWVDTRLHEAVRAQDLPALYQLLDQGASPSALDWEGRTPLHLCVEHRLRKPLNVLLSAPGAADVRDASGWPLLHAALLRDWKEGARAILAASPDITTTHFSCFRETGAKKPEVSLLEKYLKHVLDLPLSIAIQQNDMEMFEAILTVAERNNAIDCRDGCGDTALCTAIVTSNLPAVQKLLMKGASPYRVTTRNESALHLAVCFPNILEYLLNNTDVTSSLDIGGLAPEHRAVACGLKPMRLLLDKFSNTRVKTEPQGYTPLHYAAIERGNKAAAKLIINRDSGAIDEEDNQGDTPLLVAVKHNNRDLAKLLLRKGAQLSTTDKSGATVLRLISSNFYKASIFFEQVFDKCIFYKDACNTNALLVNVDYRVLTDGKELSQINMLEELVSCGHSKILLHPLIESLVHLKWSNFLTLFYNMIGVYTVFLLSSTILMTSSFYFEDMYSKTMNNSSVILGTPSNNGTTSGSRGSHGGGYWLLVVLTYLSTFILLLQEYLFMNLKRRRYFTSVESYVKLIGLVLCAVAPPLAALVSGPWPRYVTCAALILTWIQAMFLVSRLPWCGYYMLMFEKAIFNMLKVFLTAIFLLIAFTLCFMIEYHLEAPFDGLIAAFVKTLVMMIPEFDFESLFGANHEALRDAKPFAYIIFVIFVILVPTIFMNFMYAVAVSDVNELNETGNIRRLEKQLEVLSTFDPLVYDGVIGKWLKNMFVDKRYHESMYTVKANQSTWRVRCWPYPYQPTFQKKCFAVSSMYFCKDFDCENYVGTPMSPESLNSDLIYSIEIDNPELYNAIVAIANKCGDQRKRTKNNGKGKKNRCKVDALYETMVGSDNDEDESEEDTDTDDDTRSDSDLITLKKHMKSIINDISKVSKENKDLKRTVNNLNLKVSNMSEISTDISRNIDGPNWTSLSRLTRRPRHRTGGTGSKLKSSSKHPKLQLNRKDTPASSSNF